MKDIIITILILIIVISFSYILILNLQIKSINNQIKLKLHEKNTRPITVQFIGKKIIMLVMNINKALKNEEDLRLETIKNENDFKNMIANISHDLRTPLAAIKGYQELMLLDSLSENQKNKIEIAMKHTDELGDLIEHFFEYSRLINSKPKVNMKKINLTSTVVECIISAIPQFEKKNMKVNFDDSNIVYAVADKEMVNRIILNLLGNALKYSTGNVYVNLCSCSEYVQLSVKNSVSNLKKADEKKIFERFYSLDPSRNRSGGLGLSIVKLLAEEMGGKADAIIDGENIEIRIKLKENTIFH